MGGSVFFGDSELVDDSDFGDSEMGRYPDYRDSETGGDPNFLFGDLDFF